MPKIPIDEAPAGPAMDAAVAEALGWRQLSYRLWHNNDGRERWIDDKYGAWSPSTDIAAAWELIEELKNEHKLLAVLIEWPEGWSVAFSHTPIKYSAIAETAPLAICRAFLKANGVEFVEVPE